MRTFKVVTSQNKPYYDLIGKECLESFLKYWPKEISIELWAENFIPDIEDERLIIKDWNRINPRFNNFVNLIKEETDDEKILSREKFWMKGHVTLTAMEEFDKDVFIWLDSDVITHSELTIEIINKLIPDNYLSVDIPAGGKGRGKEIESGFYCLNFKHPMISTITDYYKLCHTTNKILDVPRALETGVLWKSVESCRKKGALVNHLEASEDTLYPFEHTVLKQYMKHYITPHGKKELQHAKKKDSTNLHNNEKRRKKASKLSKQHKENSRNL